MVLAEEVEPFDLWSLNEPRKTQPQQVVVHVEMGAAHFAPCLHLHEAHLHYSHGVHGCFALFLETLVAIPGVTMSSSESSLVDVDGVVQVRIPAEVPMFHDHAVDDS